MRFLLDTNVLSEVAKPAPDPRVLEWLRTQPPLDLAVSVLTFGEIQKGLATMAPGARKTTLETWLATDLPHQFAGRVLELSVEVALRWGKLAAEGRQRGRELPVIDGLLLATADAYRLTLVTRNERDCSDRGVPVFNPWDG